MGDYGKARDNQATEARNEKCYKGGNLAKAQTAVLRIEAVTRGGNTKPKVPIQTCEGYALRGEFDDGVGSTSQVLFVRTLY